VVRPTRIGQVSDALGEDEPETVEQRFEVPAGGGERGGIGPGIDWGIDWGIDLGIGELGASERSVAGVHCR
jgi:hypothetical protein